MGNSEQAINIVIGHYICLSFQTIYRCIISVLYRLLQPLQVICPRIPPHLALYLPASDSYQPHLVHHARYPDSPLSEPTTKSFRASSTIYRSTTFAPTEIIIISTVCSTTKSDRYRWWKHTTTTTATTTTAAPNHGSSFRLARTCLCCRIERGGPSS